MGLTRNEGFSPNMQQFFHGEHELSKQCVLGYAPFLLTNLSGYTTGSCHKPVVEHKKEVNAL